jgi:hypothetical protein
MPLVHPSIAPSEVLHIYPTYQQVHQANLVCQLTENELINISIFDNNCIIKKWQANAIIDPVTGDKQQYHHIIQQDITKPLWTRSGSDERGCLAPGNSNELPPSSSFVTVISPEA